MEVNMNKLVAIVGMSGTGKSVVTDYLEEQNWKKLYLLQIILNLTENHKKKWKKSDRKHLLI